MGYDLYRYLVTLRREYYSNQILADKVSETEKKDFYDIIDRIKVRLEEQRTLIVLRKGKLDETLVSKDEIEVIRTYH